MPEPTIEIERACEPRVLLPVADEAIAHVDFDRRIIVVNDVARFAVQDGNPCPAEDQNED